MTLLPSILPPEPIKNSVRADFLNPRCASFAPKIFLCALSLIFPATISALAQSTTLDTNALATLAVQDHGRKKPFTTFASESLLTLSGVSHLSDDRSKIADQYLSPEQVILDLWFKPQGWDDRPLIIVTFRALKAKLGLPLETDKKLFTYNQLISSPALMALLDQAQKLEQSGDKDKLTDLEKEAEHLGERLRLFQNLVNGEAQAVVPNANSSEGRWANPQLQRMGNDRAYSIVAADSAAQKNANDTFNQWYQAYAADDLPRFNSLTPQVVESLRQIAPEFYPSAASLQFEHRYMTLHPFRWAWIVYLIALLILGLTAIWARDLGYRLTWAGVIFGLGLEAYGFFCRIVISGRPPVTDLYETVIWVSFIGMVFAVILEAVYRKRYFFYAGIPATIITLIVADSGSSVLNASINPLTPVLRDNMWLTIHVLTIVSSYAAFALTAALGHIALAMTFGGARYAKAMDEVQFFIYRAMQIGILLLATGTILGGVWANYSWGRFWGWDPKETWALITLLCYLAVLHGRLVGWWHGFGIAVGAVIGFLSVMMSWYGVNFILGQNGRSLHSYGLGTGGLSYATGFAGVEILFVAVVIFWNRKHGVLRPRAPVSSKP